MRYRNTKKQAVFRKYRRRMTRKRIQSGGEGQSINIRQLLLTNPIIECATRIRGSAINLTPYTIEKDKHQQGFGLGRLEQIQKANLNSLEPITIRKKRNSKGRLMGTVINRTMPRVQLYTIVDGRHRVAKALAEGRQTIHAKMDPSDD